MAMTAGEERTGGVRRRPCFRFAALALMPATARPAMRFAGSLWPPEALPPPPAD